MFIKFKKKDEIFNLSSGIKYNVRTILKKIIKASNKKKNYPIKISKGTPGDSFGFHTKSKKLKKLFKFKPNYNLDKGLKFYFQCPTHHSEHLFHLSLVLYWGQC